MKHTTTFKYTSKPIDAIDAMRLRNVLILFGCLITYHVFLAEEKGES